MESTLPLSFEDYDKTAYLLKFGKKKHLEELKNGRIRFSNLEIYKDYENNKSIGDSDEGLTDILQQKDIMQIIFSHPLINSGKSIDVTNQIKEVKNYVNLHKYISCFTYFTQKDILEKSIFSDQILEEEEWDYVLWIMNSNKVVNELMSKLNKYNVKFGKVNYLDYSQSHHNLNEFSKSKNYEYQKEIRFSISYNGESEDFIKRVNEKTIEITIEPLQAVIIPTKEFREGFIIEYYKEGK